MTLTLFYFFVVLQEAEAERIKKLTVAERKLEEEKALEAMHVPLFEVEVLLQVRRGRSGGGLEGV